MLKDDKNQNTDVAVASIQQAGAAAVEADKRTTIVEAWFGPRAAPTVIAYPYAVDGSGNVVPLKEAHQLAEREHLRAHPHRDGHYRMHDLASLLAWAQRYSTADTAAFVTAPSPAATHNGSVVIIVDELPVSGPDGCRRQLRASLPLELHPRLEAWVKCQGEPMSVEELGDHVDRALDELGDAELASMISRIEVNTASNWVRTVTEDGRVSLVAEETKGTSRVPKRFSFMVPVFDDDDPADAQQFQCRLTTKIVGKKPVFTYEIIDLATKIDAAVKRVREAVAMVVPATYAGSAV